LTVDQWSAILRETRRIAGHRCAAALPHSLLLTPDASPRQGALR
jgi:hypothetical protein